ncbi:uncharacterized protein [Cherax quadricarinatus]|uniref:uncharacterized protein n=1 Tax=Cherax quadricarinatus TaxID=27406 RepID=UPI00387EA67A
MKVINTTMVVVMMVGMGAWTTLQAMAGQSITYVKGDTIGNFIIAKGLTLSDKDVYNTITMKSQSQCLSTCWSHIVCCAMAVVESEDGMIQCRLSLESPITSTLVNNTNATYYYWQDRVPGLSYELKADCFLYYISSTGLDFNSAKTLCQKLPGHRLLMPKLAAHYNTALEIFNETGNKQFWFDLQMAVEKTAYLWGDQTPYLSTPTSSVVGKIVQDTPAPVAFRMQLYNVLNDISLTSVYYGVCHANPLGLEW